MINGVKMVSLFFKENMTALSISVIREQIKQHYRAQAFFVFRAEIEIMIVGIVFNELLERTGAIRASLTEYRKGDDVPTQRFVQQISGYFTPRECIFRKVPQGLFALLGFVNSLKRLLLMCNTHKKGIIRTKSKLPLQFKGSIFKSHAQGFIYHKI